MWIAADERAMVDFYTKTARITLFSVEMPDNAEAVLNILDLNVNDACMNAPIYKCTLVTKNGNVQIHNEFVPSCGFVCRLVENPNNNTLIISVYSIKYSLRR